MNSRVQMVIRIFTVLFKKSIYSILLSYKYLCNVTKLTVKQNSVRGSIIISKMTDHDLLWLAVVMLRNVTDIIAHACVTGMFKKQT